MDEDQMYMYTTNMVAMAEAIVRIGGDASMILKDTAIRQFIETLSRNGVELKPDIGRKW